MSLMANALPTANQPGLAAITTRQQATWTSGDFAVVARTTQIRGAVGSPGRVVGLDMTPAMLDRARGHVAEASADYIELREGLMEALPFPDRSFDAVVSNGVLNLSTRKSRALAEMLRVLRPGAGGPRRARAHRHLARGDYERPDGAGGLTGRSTGGASAEEEVRSPCAPRRTRPGRRAHRGRHGPQAPLEGDPPMSIDTARLREAIQAVYGEVAGDPKKGYHFHTGPTYAVDHLGYAAADLGDLRSTTSGTRLRTWETYPTPSRGPLPAWALRSHSAHPAWGRSCWISVQAAASTPSWLPRPWARPGGSSLST